MTKQSSIKYISALLSHPSAITAADQATLAGLRQSFPYFVPLRYAAAFVAHRQGQPHSATLPAIRPYIGNWVLFCDFLHADANELPAAANTLPVSTPLPQVVVPEPLAPAAVQQDAAPQLQKEPAGAQVISKPAARPREQQPEAQKPAADYANASHWIVDEPAAQPQAIEAAIPVAADSEKQPAAHTAIPIKPVTVKGKAIKAEEPLIAPLYTEDYFLHTGAKDRAGKASDLVDYNDYKTRQAEADKALMVMMSFSEWLMHFKSTADRQKEETKDQKALKSMWQKERLAAAMEEENEEIPENVFEMAVNSIAKEDGLASESLAEIYIKQEKYDKAIEMYRKLSLRNPQKNAYFARKIEEILKEKRS